MKRLAWVLLVLLASGALDPAEAGKRRRPRKPPPPPEEPAPKACISPPPATCGALDPGEVTSLLNAAASAVSFPTLAVAVVDRLGNVLGVYVQGGPSLQVQDTAVGLARTGAFFSNDQAPLSSRTVRFVSGLHFPPGVARTGNAALYGIENTNRGCELNVSLSASCALPQGKSLNNLACNSSGGPVSTAGCGTGPVTGKVVDLSGDPRDTNPFAVNPGGIPVFRGGVLVGGIGVAGIPDAQIDAAEFAALSAVLSIGGLTPFPAPLPEPGVVFIDGIRLPFVRQTQRPAGVSATAAPPGTVILGPIGGQCATDGYLVGPTAGPNLTAAEVGRIVQQSIAAANKTRAVIRLPLGSKAKMVIAVGDENGNVLALYRMPDATMFSVDVAVAKARNVAYFSRPPGSLDVSEVPAGTAITNRTLSFGGQPLFPAGIDGSGPGPFFDLFVHDYLNPCTQGFAPPGSNQNGIVFFPGSLPLYKGNTLVGGLGISGDGVEQDDYVSFLGAAGFLPPKGLWADNHFVSGVRLPFLKFPRNPER